VESANVLTNQQANEWRVQQSYFTTTNTGQGILPLSPTNHFFRLVAVDVSANSPQGYTNLLQSYGNLHTIAGKGAPGTIGSRVLRADTPLAPHSPARTWQWQMALMVCAASGNSPPMAIAWPCMFNDNYSSPQCQLKLTTWPA